MELTLDDMEAAHEELKVTFEDVQEIQMFKEIVLTRINQVDHNISVLNSLGKLNGRLARRYIEAERDSFEEFDFMLESALSELQMHRRNFQIFLDVINSRARLVCPSLFLNVISTWLTTVQHYEILEFQTQESVSQNTEIASTLTKLQHVESTLQNDLSRRAAKDASTPRVSGLSLLLHSCICRAHL